MRNPARPIGTLVEIIEAILKANASEASANLPALTEDPQVALWVTRRGTPIQEPYILLVLSPECLRSFPHSASAAAQQEPTMQVIKTPCIFCESPISYAMLDSGLFAQPGGEDQPAGPRPLFRWLNQP